VYDNDGEVIEDFRLFASGEASHAEGYATQAKGAYSHAEGFLTTTIGQFSHAEGNTTSATGGSSHAEGTQTIASGSYSHAEGNQTIATGFASHAEGLVTTTIGGYSHTEGAYTIASGDYQHVQGQYNKTSSISSAFIHGNGTSDVARSNLIFAAGSTVQITGSLQVSGSITGSLLGTASNIATTANIKTINSSSLIGSGNLVLPFNLMSYGSAVSGSTTLTKSASFLLAANTLTNKDALIHLKWRGRRFGAANVGTVTFGLYNNTSDSTSGAVFLTSNTLTAVASRMGQSEVHLLYKAETGTVERQTPGTLGTDMGLNTLTYTSVGFNRTVDNYFIFTLTNASAADSSIIDFGMAIIYI